MVGPEGGGSDTAAAWAEPEPLARFFRRSDGLAVGPGGGLGFGGALEGSHAAQAGGLAVGRAGGFGYDGALGGAGAAGAHFGQTDGLAGGPMGGLGHGGAFGEAGPAGAPSGAFSHNGGAATP